MNEMVCPICGQYIDMTEHDAKVRAEVIAEINHIINKYSEYARPVGWSKKTEIICTSILKDEIERLKERNNEANIGKL